MTIGVDAGALGIKDERLKVGTYQVAKNLLLELSKIDKVNEYLLFSFYPFEKELKNKLSENFKPIIFKPARGFFKFRLPLEFIFKKIDLFLALNQAVPWFHPFKTITFVHDIAFEHYPECYPDSSKNLTLRTKNTVINSDRIIVPSKAVANDLVQFYRVNPKKIKVIYEGVNQLPRSDKIDFKKYQPYFLYVGSYKRIKNLPRLLTAFARFKKSDKQNFKLLLAGSNYWLDPEIEEIIKKEKLHNSVVNLGFINDSKIKSLYSNAFAFLSPSLYEGFGLTVLEAMSCGCPVIVGDRGASREIVGNAGILVEPESVDSIYKGIQGLVENPELRQKLIKLGGKGVKKFSWKKFAKEFYREITRI